MFINAVVPGPDPGPSFPGADSAPLTLLVAPGGYGKRRLLADWLATVSGPAISLGPVDGFSDAWFALFAERCQAEGLPIPDPDQPRRWARELGATALTIAIDSWEQLEIQDRIASFWQTLLDAPPAGLRLWLASRKPPRLPVATLIAAGGRYLDRLALSWSWETYRDYLTGLGLRPDDSDHQSWTASAGWPLGLLLAARLRSGELSESAYETLLTQALSEWLPAFGRDPNQLWLPETQARLREWQAGPEHWPPLLARQIARASRSQPAYWLGQAIASESRPPAETRVLLERALSLCTPQQAALRLNLLTRLAHMASLQGDVAALDCWLAEGAELIDEAQSVDVAAWYYLQANRARQLCRYEAAHAALDALLALPARMPAVMNFQLRARILRGLTAYQQGDYALTRRAYREALTLAEADGKTQTLLELRIMLAFLDALQGQAEDSPAELGEAVFAEVEALPLSAQPLVWLNLAFYRLLGEHLDLRQGQAIIARVRACAAALEWDSLEPMINDVEARLWRFHQDYDRAGRLHAQALSRLEPGTFDWLYASLNQALTLLRRRQLSEAREQLEAIVAMAGVSGTFGLLREAQAALQALAPQPDLPGKPQPVASPVLVAAGGDEPLLEIQCFGSFQVRLDGKPIERWPRKRARHLLLQLLLHPHGIHRETLADWLTGSDELEAALRSLDVQVHALRKLLEPERKGKQASRYIRFHDAVYSFHWGCHYRWDVEGFAAAYQRWLALRDEDALAAEGAVADALAIYSGPFLPELDFADEWLAERESYARKAGDLVLWSLDYLSSAGAHERAEDRAELLLKWDSISEQGFAWLLRLAGQLRDRVRLERLGERMEQTFEKELGCPPPKELLQLYRAQLLQMG